VLGDKVVLLLKKRFKALFFYHIFKTKTKKNKREGERRDVGDRKK